MLTVHPHDLKPEMVATALYTHGLGMLPYCTEARTKQKINGDWCLTLTYPKDKPGAELLVTDRLIACEGQLYRILRVSPKDGRRGRFVTVEAPHICYDLDELSIVNIETKEDDRYPDGINVRQAMEQILADTPFTVGSVDVDLEELNYLEILQISPLQAIKEQVLALWGGELVFDNFSVHLRQQMGIDRRFPIRAKRNIDEISFVEDITEVITRLHVRGYQNANFEEINEGRDYIDSIYIGKYSHIKEGYIDFDDEDDPHELMRMGRAHLAKVETPKVTYTVSLAPLEGSIQYTQFQALERYGLGDTAVLHHDYLEADILVRAFEVERDILKGCNTQVALGNPQEDMITSIIAGQIAADTVTKLTTADGYLRAEKLSGPLDFVRITNLVSETIRVVVAKIQEVTAGTVQTNELYSEVIAAVAAEIRRVTAQEVQTNALYAQIIKAVTADLERISASEIRTHMLEAVAADIASLNAGELYAAIISAVQADINVVEAGRLRAALAEISRLEVQNAVIDAAQVRDLSTGTVIFERGQGDTLTLKNVTVTDASIITLTAGKLLLKGVDGRFYEIQVNEDGTVTPVEAPVQESNLADGSVGSGKIIEHAITAAHLKVDEIFGDTALFGAVTASNINVASLFASEAFVGSLRTHLIQSDYLSVVISEAEGIFESLKTYFDFSADALWISKDSSEFSIKISNEEMGFYQGGQKIVYVSHSQAHMPRLTVDETLTLGAFAFTAESNGSLSLVYAG